MSIEKESGQGLNSRTLGLNEVLGVCVEETSTKKEERKKRKRDWEPLYPGGHAECFNYIPDIIIAQFYLLPLEKRVLSSEPAALTEADTSLPLQSGVSLEELRDRVS